MTRIHKRKQRQALFEVVCLGQNPGFGIGPNRNERKAAKWAGRVLKEQERMHEADPMLAKIIDREVKP